MADVISLADAKFEHEWQRILPILKEAEAAFDAQPITLQEQAEEAAIAAQLHAIDLCTRAKVLLLRALSNQEKGQLTTSEVRLKKLLNTDKAVIHALNLDNNNACQHPESPGLPGAAR